MEEAVLDDKPEFVKFFMQVKNDSRLCDFLTYKRLSKFYEVNATLYYDSSYAKKIIN